MSDAIVTFISRWKPSGGNEVPNFPSFAAELTQLLEVEPPKPAASDGQNNDYRFERPVTFTHTGKLGRGRIDLYRRGCFIVEPNKVQMPKLPQLTNLPCWAMIMRSPKKATANVVRPNGTTPCCAPAIRPMAMPAPW